MANTAIDLQTPLVGKDDALCDAHAKPCPLGPRGEEGIEDVFYDLFGNATATISDHYLVGVVIVHRRDYLDGCTRAG